MYIWGMGKNTSGARTGKKATVLWQFSRLSGLGAIPVSQAQPHGPMRWRAADGADTLPRCERTQQTQRWGFAALFLLKSPQAPN